jgi:tRNA(Ile)-lysidine synthase
MELAATIAETIHRQDLIQPSQTVLVAVSGGPDSVALLHCLIRLGYSVEAAHLNHQFRGTEAEDDAIFVTSLCRSLSVKLTQESRNVPKIQSEERVSPQQAARKTRYSFLEQVRCERGLDVIATAHNLDDRVETVLINILRGTGVDGLRGIPYRRGHIIRPLLDTSRKIVEDYCLSENLEPRIDSSNKLSKYTRNNVRAELLPYLERRYSMSVRDSLLRLSEIAADESDYLNSTAAYWLGNQPTIAVDEFQKEATAFQRRILRQWIRVHIPNELSDVSHILVEQFRKHIARPYAVTLPGGRYVLESNGASASVRELVEPPTRVVDVVPITLGETAVFGPYLVTVDSVVGGVDKHSLHVRQWINGDRIALVGGTKKIQDVFTDRKIACEARRFYPLIADDHGLVAVGSIRLAARAVGSMISVAWSNP